jgi:two-component system, chemotaxis family, CheB/CheR fusion protein
VVNPLLTRLADYILAARESIIERWVAEVIDHPEVPSARKLTREELIDHLPALLDQLAARLREGTPPVPGGTQAHAHGLHRWQQGFAVEEMIREAGLVRRIVAVECLDAFRLEEPAFRAASRHEAEAVIHQFLTDMVAESARQFAAASESARHAAEQNSRAILESALDSIIVMGGDGLVREWNPAAEALFGYSRAEAVGKELAELILPPEYREPHRRGLEKYFRTGEGPVLGRRIEVPALLRDGSRILAELAITPYRVEEETLFTGSIRDITARRAAEEASQRLAAIVEWSSDAIISTTLDGVITSWNDGARQLFGYTREEAVGQRITMLLPPNEELRDREFMARIRNGERIAAFEATRHRKDGSTVPVSLTLSPIRDFNGNVIGASRILRDITARRRTEEELRRQKEAAENANQAKDRFLATLSHELRTPLNPVLMWAFSMADNEDLDPEIREGLKMVCRNVEMEARLIDDLLDLTRVARGKLKLELQPCDADVLLRHALGIVQTKATVKKHRISVDLSAREHRIMADPIRVEQVFWNLLINAQKFTPEGGEIAVRSYDAAPGMLAFEVSDSGPGIDEHLMPKLFEAFEQGQPDSQGLGLGLAICQAIMRLHGGNITGWNKENGGGAVFTVEFKTLGVSEQQAASPAAGGADGSRPLRILIVEDHEHTATVMQRLLNREGHSVRVAATVREAIDAMRATPFDLLVSDLGLPDGNGFEVMRELARISDAKGIAVSGYGMEEDIARSSRAGFSAHLTKPINVAKLKETIQQVTASA